MKYEVETKCIHLEQEQKIKEQGLWIYGYL